MEWNGMRLTIDMMVRVDIDKDGKKLKRRENKLSKSENWQERENEREELKMMRLNEKNWIQRERLKEW